MLHISKMVKKLVDSWLWNLNSWGLVYSERTNRKRASMGLGGSTKGAWQNSITVRVRAQPSGFAPFFWSGHTKRKSTGQNTTENEAKQFSLLTRGLVSGSGLIFCVLPLTSIYDNENVCLKRLSRTLNVHRTVECFSSDLLIDHKNTWVNGFWPLTTPEKIIRRNGPKRYNKLMT